MKNNNSWIVWLIALVAIVALVIAIFVLMSVRRSGENGDTCIEKDGACCKGEICARAFPNCEEGYSLSYIGCEEDCTPFIACDPSS